MDLAPLTERLEIISTPLTMVAALLLNRFLPIPYHYHPLILLRELARQLQRRVFHQHTSPPLQQQIAGALGLMLLLLPCLLLLIFFSYLSEYPMLWQLLLLYLALDWQQSRATGLRIALQLEKSYKIQARETLAALVLRQTSQLSSMGICKATIEALLQRANGQLFAVLFWYLLGGGIAAVAYRGIRELSMLWNRKLPQFSDFGKIAGTLTTLLDVIPVRFLALSFCLAGRFTPFWKHLKGISGQFPYNHSGLLLACGAYALKRELSGPLYYQQQKIQRCKFSAGAVPIPEDILLCLRLIDNALLFWLTLFLLVTVVLTLFA